MIHEDFYDNRRDAARCYGENDSVEVGCEKLFQFLQHANPILFSTQRLIGKGEFQISVSRDVRGFQCLGHVAAMRHRHGPVHGAMHQEQREQQGSSQRRIGGCSRSLRDSGGLESLLLSTCPCILPVPESTPLQRSAPYRQQGTYHHSTPAIRRTHKRKTGRSPFSPESLSTDRCATFFCLSHRLRVVEEAAETYADTAKADARPNRNRRSKRSTGVTAHSTLK